MKKELFKMKKGLLVMMMAAMAITFTACGSSESEEVQAEQGSALESEEAGEEVSFIFRMMDHEGEEHQSEIITNKKTVGAALIDQGYINGTDSEYGLMIDTVLGIHLDWDETGMYWAFYVDGEYATSGVDSTEIVEGQIYSFIAE